MFKNGTEFCGEFPFDDFRVIILKVNSCDGIIFQAWLRQEDYCIMDFMFGLKENVDMDLEKFKSVVMKNIVKAIHNYVLRYLR